MTQTRETCRKELKVGIASYEDSRGESIPFFEFLSADKNQ